MATQRSPISYFEKDALAGRFDLTLCCNDYVCDVQRIHRSILNIVYIYITYINYIIMASIAEFEWIGFLYTSY